MTEAGLCKINAARKNEEWYKTSKTEIAMPQDITKALKANKKAWENFNNLVPSYQKQYKGRIMSAEKEETRLKRIKETVRLSTLNKKLGMM